MKMVNVTITAAPQKRVVNACGFWIKKADGKVVKFDWSDEPLEKVAKQMKPYDDYKWSYGKNWGYDKVSPSEGYFYVDQNSPKEFEGSRALGQFIMYVLHGA